MGNRVTYKRRMPPLSLDMSNLHTSAFVLVLSVAASRLAQSSREQRLASWLASRNQSLFGLGCVGFDISEMPWSASLEDFEEDRDFLERVAERAWSKRDWAEFGYDGHRSLQSLLGAFLGMIRELEFDHLSGERGGWELATLTTCPTHGTYEYLSSCVVCDSA